ncbi:methyltransferase type 11 [Paenibacillus yonginensis]|uniref:Methyltransferase type 11 n=1 Tax=Paenibacillus yonginensis TaxID=1462996 RepID=A0A1B1MVY2_9BACL|nr:methyltransferase domain-containing protein [Paenibacillus yonginensis]ANS73324.1 methyltransferase type 11 [Paenibacillus yonginensis]
MDKKAATGETGSDKKGTGELDGKPGNGALALLQPAPGERILDAGCGTGDLTAAMAAAGAIPTGIDVSGEAVKRAALKYPSLSFRTGDIRHYRTKVRFDAVFSHAVIHWIKDAPEVITSIRLALREGGRFVAEFAGSGNVSTLTAAMKETLEEEGYVWEGRNPWYLPTADQYAELLEQNGFRVMEARHFDHPTPLKAGVRKWLNSFSPYFFADVPEDAKSTMFEAIENRVKPQLYRDGQWMADTSRLRIAAIKI